MHSDDLKRKNGDDDLDGVVDDDEKRNRIDERNRRIKLKAFNNDGHQRRNHVSFDENQIENLRQQQQQHQHQHQQQHHHQQQRNQESMIDELQSQNKLDNNSSSDLVDREPKQQQPQSQWKRDAIDDSQNYDNHLLNKSAEINRKNLNQNQSTSDYSVHSSSPPHNTTKSSPSFVLDQSDRLRSDPKRFSFDQSIPILNQTKKSSLVKRSRSNLERTADNYLRLFRSTNDKMTSSSMNNPLTPKAPQQSPQPQQQLQQQQSIVSSSSMINGHGSVGHQSAFFSGNGMIFSSIY